MSKISKKWIIKQLKNDLFGKDSHRGVTLTYSWFANQVGHFSLGFVPTILFERLISAKTEFENPAIVTALFVSIFWIIFEGLNFSIPILKRKKQIFSPKWNNIIFDTVTDLCFFFIGAFIASLFLFYTHVNLIIIVSLLLLIIYPVSYWFLTKMYQSYAFFPFQFRLSQWSFNINENNKKIISSFLKQKSVGEHVLIFGPKRSGKTSLGVGILNELSIKHKTCLYTTAIKLYSLFYTTNTNSFNNNQIWSWRNTDYLIIDDINPGDPIKKNIVSPETFLNFIDSSKDSNPINRDIIKKKNIIWVLGDEFASDKLNYSSWISMLEKIGVKREKIKIINLSKNNY